MFLLSTIVTMVFCSYLFGYENIKQSPLFWVFSLIISLSFIAWFEMTLQEEKEKNNKMIAEMKEKEAKDLENAVKAEIFANSLELRRMKIIRQETKEENIYSLDD